MLHHAAMSVDRNAAICKLSSAWNDRSNSALHGSFKKLAGADRLVVLSQAKCDETVLKPGMFFFFFNFVSQQVYCHGCSLIGMHTYSS